jgi:hypothetical protein
MHVSWNRESAKLGKLTKNTSTINPNFWDSGMGSFPTRIESDTTTIAINIANAA